VMYRLHRLGELELVVLVAEDDWPNALALADSLLRLDHARFDSARGWLSIMIALSNLHTLYRLLEAIRIRYEQHIDKPDDHQAAWNLVLQYCRAPSDPVAALRRTVIAEYLIGVTALGLVTQLEGADSGSELPGWLYNRALTHRMLNDHYTRLMDWVMHPQRRSDDADYEQPTAAGFGWWFRNPVGKLVIDLITPVFRMRVSDFTETHAELDAVRRRLAARLVEN